MKAESLKSKVYHSLRQDIVTGRLKGGTRLTEIAIATSLDVSRTPVREALQKLSQERLLINIPKAGYMVEDLSDDDIQDLFTTRMEIEQIVILKAVKFITVEELKSLDDNLEQTRIAVKSGDDFTLTEMDNAFHCILYAAARSRSLFRICKHLGDLTIKYRHSLNLSASIRKQLLHHHLDIYKALIAKDSTRAVRAVETHGTKAMEFLRETMKKIRSESFSLEEF